MREIVQKLAKVEKEVALEKGTFNLFALVLREDAPGLWDLLVAARWVQENKELALKYIAAKIKKVLTSQEIMNLSRIVVIEQDNPALKALQKTIHVEESVVELQDSMLFGLPIKHAYIIASRGDKEPARATQK